MKHKIKWRVLVFPAGTENGLEIWKALKDCKEVQLFAATQKGVNHSEFVYERCSYVRSVSDVMWFDDLKRVINELNIDYVYPANSLVIDALVERRDEIPCEVALPDSSLVRITRSKNETLRRLSADIPVPRLYDLSKNEGIDFPIFVKPDGGYGSIDAFCLKSQEAVDLFVREHRTEKYIFQEYLPGKEYSVDCLSDSKEVLFCAPRSRERIRMGTSMHSEIIEGSVAAKLEGMARNIYSKLPITGAWFFQVKEDAQGELKLLEVDIRIAGTMALNRVRGINFPLLSLYIFSGYPIELLKNECSVVIDRCLKNRYRHNIQFDKVYVDLDDTLILTKSALNIELVSFLYQCVNKSIRIILLSKNLVQDKVSYLKRWRVFELFDQVVWLDEAERKSDYIRRLGPDNAIFIDDSFSQRQDVSRTLGIPTFDCTMIEMLLDDRL